MRERIFGKQLPLSHLTTFLREEQYKKHTNGYYTKIKNASYKINSEQNLKINKIADDLRCYNIVGSKIVDNALSYISKKNIDHVLSHVQVLSYVGNP